MSKGPKESVELSPEGARYAHKRNAVRIDLQRIFDELDAGQGVETSDEAFAAFVDGRAANYSA